MGNRLRETNSTGPDADYSIYTLPQLFKARYWDETRGRSLEEEIEKRCTHIRERTNGKPSVGGRRSTGRFRPYGFIFGVAFLLLSVGPFVSVKFLDTINVINDAYGDKVGLSGAWALLTLPVMLMIFTIGSIRDAERVVKWFNLAGRS